jgi:hypothetical protein
MLERGVGSPKPSGCTPVTAVVRLKNQLPLPLRSEIDDQSNDRSILGYDDGRHICSTESMFPPSRNRSIDATTEADTILMGRLELMDVVKR